MEPERSWQALGQVTELALFPRPWPKEPKLWVNNWFYQRKEEEDELCCLFPTYNKFP